MSYNEYYKNQARKIQSGAGCVIKVTQFKQVMGWVDSTTYLKADFSGCYLLYARTLLLLKKEHKL